ncbi:hypothetical protein [Streptosporangium sp. NBC_01756]|uniref:hypothetical protein n=1 Tax=Streptosporangium sp. NBC_01756 TaxID=2975950 RepID=UPI002DDC28A1|nr:hypothetical protein [Streptosporangium sp. NBC_01756]WSC85299.1 hypothetical protein OIE48_33855 [Streptosporangium sp. NBC_01756]
MSEPRLLVPVRVGTFAAALRLFRTAAGKRTAVAFSSPLRAVADGTARVAVRRAELDDLLRRDAGL